MKPQCVCTCGMPSNLAKSETWRSASMRAARVLGGTRPIVEGPCVKFHSRGGGPTTSTVVAVSSYFASRLRICAAASGVNPLMYPSRERKQLVKPSSCTRRMFASGAPKGLMSSPKAMGLIGSVVAAARDAAGQSPSARMAADAKPRNVRRFICGTLDLVSNIGGLRSFSSFRSTACPGRRQLANDSASCHTAVPAQAKSLLNRAHRLGITILLGQMASTGKLVHRHLALIALGDGGPKLPRGRTLENIRGCAHQIEEYDLIAPLVQPRARHK